MGSLINTIADLPGSSVEQPIEDILDVERPGPWQQTQRLWLGAALLRNGPVAVEPRHYPDGIRWLLRKLMHSDPEIYLRIN